MIVWVCNISLTHARAVAGGGRPVRVPAPPASAVAYVGVLEPPHRSPFAALRPSLCVEMQDYDPEGFARRGAILLGETPPGFAADGPTPERAARIAAFVREQHARPEPVALWVHCMMGVSRSGAVAAWVHETTGCEWASAECIGRDRADPNETLLRMLRETP